MLVRWVDSKGDKLLFAVVVVLVVRLLYWVVFDPICHQTISPGCKVRGNGLTENQTLAWSWKCCSTQIERLRSVRYQDAFLDSGVPPDLEVQPISVKPQICLVLYSRMMKCSALACLQVEMLLKH